jgi:hypothetical protein
VKLCEPTRDDDPYLRASIGAFNRARGSALIGAVKMPTDRQGTRYLIVLTLGDAVPTRLQTLVPDLQAILKDACTSSELAFRSITRDVFGYFAASTLSAHQLKTKIETPDRRQPFLNNSDAVLIVELGEHFDASGRSKAWTWLQHH